MKRRSFLGSILAAGMAPAIGQAGILMPVRKIARVDPFGQFGYVKWGESTDIATTLQQFLWQDAQDAQAMMDSMRFGTVAYIDTPRHGGGINRRYIPVRDFYPDPAWRPT